MPAANTPNPQVATSAALTVQAAIHVTVTPFASLTAASLPMTDTTQTVTPTYSKPMASVSDVTNCRTGPGKSYERVTQIFPTDQVEIVGFFSPNYWIVRTSSGDCWLSGEFTTPVGSLISVPTVTAPPTPKGGAPEAATFLSKDGWTFSCYGPGQADITLNWNDKSETETGYKILRNDEVITELPPNSTRFSETILLNSGQSVTYKIRAYNQIGETDSSPVEITCP
jgi:hypothetical protein